MSSAPWFKPAMSSPCCGARLHKSGIQNEQQRYRCTGCGSKQTQHTAGMDYRGSHAVYTSLGRTYLGTIQDTFWDNDGLLRASIIHFNGEAWPFQPPLSLLEILEREES